MPRARTSTESDRPRILENILTLEVPDQLTLPDGTTAVVRTVTATVTDGHLDRVVYTVEKASGAWLDVAADASPTLPALTTASP